MPDLALVVERLTVGYGTAPIVKAVSLRVEAGEFVVIVGPNGSGKSTTMKGIAGVLRSTGGRVRLEGSGSCELTNLPPEQAVRRGIGYVPQHSNVFPSLTVQENLELGAYINRRVLKQKLTETFALFPDLAKARRRAARTLSGGQRGMLALGRALMSSPKIMLVDEPTAGLSPRYRHVVWDQLLLLRQTGVALLVVEQNTRAALELGDRGYVLVAGEVRHAGPCADLLANEELIRLYIGGQQSVSISAANGKEA